MPRHISRYTGTEKTDCNTIFFMNILQFTRIPEYLLYSPKKYIDNFENHNITRPGQGDDIINLTLKPHRRVFFFNLIPFFTEIKTYPPSSPLKKP